MLENTKENIQVFRKKLGSAKLTEQTKSSIKEILARLVLLASTLQGCLQDDGYASSEHLESFKQ